MPDAVRQHEVRVGVVVGHCTKDLEGNQPCGICPTGSLSGSCVSEIFLRAPVPFAALRVTPPAGTSGLFPRSAWTTTLATLRTTAAGSLTVGPLTATAAASLP